MELQLGLALNSYGYELKQSSFDINVNNNNSSSSSSSSGGGYGGSKKRRCFEEVVRIVPKTLPLMIWDTNRQPNDEDDPSSDLDDNSSSAIFKNDGEGLVGWPPVKAWRKKLRRHVPNCRAENNRVVATENRRGGTSSNSTYVKVKMEGNGIARKIDIRVHHSFESLTTTLTRMFDISDENCQKSFKLTYQDTEGDWLLAEDVPWRTFIRSLKCIKLIRSRC